MKRSPTRWASTEGDRLESLYAVALGLGLRQSECLGLQWGDIDLAANTLSVRRTLQRIRGEYLFQEPKTARSRRQLNLPQPLSVLLTSHRTHQLEERLVGGAAWRGDEWGGLVFADELGQPLSGYYVTKHFRRLLADADVPSMRFHDLRHGAATVLLSLGVDVRRIMETLGHSQIHVTLNTYAGVVPQFQRDAADRVGQALWGTA